MSELNRFDVEREKKKARSLLRCAEGIQALREVTGFNFVLAGEAKEEKKPIVATLIPSHSGPKPQTIQAFEAMVAYSRPYCVVLPQPSVSSSIVHWVRNDLLARLYKSQAPFDYVLFMDDDIVPPEDALVKLLAHQKDIVAGACTVRQDPPLPNFRTFDEKAMQFRTAHTWPEGLVNVGGVGTGFMLISKDALSKVADYYLNCRHEKEFFGMPREVGESISEGRWDFLKETNNAWWFECLKHPYGRGEYGEDISFCFKAMRCGIPIFVDTTVKCRHMGDYGYSLDDFYQYRDSVPDLDTVPLTAAGVPADASDMSISLLVPTRGRPENVKRLLDSIGQTASQFPEVVFYVDEDDEAMKPYVDKGGNGIKFVVGPRITLSQCWNECAKVATGDILMHAGDDIIFKTEGWDVMVKQAFQACPDRILFVHGEDGHWHDKFGTHGFIHRKWMETVGYFVPPYFSSDFNDTWLNEVANALGRRKFLPFVTEHMHPLFKKAEWDQTHLERLERHKKDGVEDIYKSKAPERQRDIELLRKVINGEVVNSDTNSAEPSGVSETATVEA